MTVCFITFGCKVNQSESQKWELILRSYGYNVTDKKENADIWIINTCAVTKKAEVQSKRIIKKAKELGIKAIVTGCYVSLEDIGNYHKIKVFPNTKKDDIIKEFDPICKSNALEISRHRAIIKIQDGCDLFCSYCIVPYLRGKPRSIPPNDIIKEINQYEEMGIKEVVLSGVNLGLYGKDLNPQLNINFLLREVLEKTMISKIRLSSIEIYHINDEFLEIIGDQRVCKHLHIPLQHGSDRVLKLMNRQYDTMTYKRFFDKIIDKYPNISIGTDIIVGYPSETERDFEDTLRFIEKLEFSYLHVFSYSSRPLTEASKHKDQVSEAVKRLRSEILIDLGKKLKEKYIKRFIGSKLDMVVESKKFGYLAGTSDNYIKCIVKDEKIQPGSLIKIFVNEVQGFAAFGSVVS